MTGKNNISPFSPEYIEKLRKSQRDYTPLILAAMNLEAEQVKDLLLKGADVQKRTDSERTALHMVADFGYGYVEKALEIINLLLDNGAEINVQNNIGVTPLMLASYRRQLPLVRLLIERGADVNIRRHNGDTILASIFGAPSLRKNSKRLIKLLEEADGIV